MTCFLGEWVVTMDELPGVGQEQREYAQRRALARRGQERAQSTAPGDVLVGSGAAAAGSGAVGSCWSRGVLAFKELGSHAARVHLGTSEGLDLLFGQHSAINPLARWKTAIQIQPNMVLDPIRFSVAVTDKGAILYNMDLVDARK